MKRKKIIIILTLLFEAAALIPTASYGAVSNEWRKTNNLWYLYENGKKVTGWKQNGSQWYYFNNDGSMATGWILDNNKWYYLNSDGSMKTGWFFNGVNWYYLNGDGSMQTGWLLNNNTWYYLNSDGSMKIGWLFDGADWYYLNGDGSMKTGWLLYQNDWYYFYDDGRMAHDTIINGCQLNSNGVWIRNDQDKHILNVDANDNSESEDVHNNSQNNSHGHSSSSNNNSNTDNSESNNTGSNTSGSADNSQNNNAGSNTSGSTDNNQNNNAGNNTSGSNNSSNNNTGNNSSSTDNKVYTFEEGLKKFSVDSASAVLKNQDQTINNTYSPVNFYMLLSVLGEGADNGTKEKILKTLHVSDADKLINQYQELYKANVYDTYEKECSIENSVWIDDDNNIKFNKNTLEKIEKDYGIDVFQGDIQSYTNAKKMNEWFLKNTNGYSGDNTSSFMGNSNEAMCIFSAMYFYDQWNNGLSKLSIDTFDFELGNGNKEKRDFLSQKLKVKLNDKGDGYKAGRIDLKSGNKMVFILPNEGSTPYDIIDDADKLNNALDSLNGSNAKTQEIYLRVPKFKFSSNINLGESMKQLGLGGIFDKQNADFTKFIAGSNSLSLKMNQSTVVSINGDNDVNVKNNAGNNISNEMTLNRPFIFAVMNNDNIPLFVGVINNPQI